MWWGGGVVVVQDVGETQEKKKIVKGWNSRKLKVNEKSEVRISLDSCNRHMRQKKGVGAQRTWTKRREKDSPNPRKEKE
jgi:hypothetical protein